MIRRCQAADFEDILAVINDGARAYRGVIPAESWHEPYMGAAELAREIADGVAFWGFEENGRLVGVMGVQPVRDVALIRHAYVRGAAQRRGIGGGLLRALGRRTHRPLLIGTWAAASWAIRFYLRNGFRLVPRRRKGALLRTYWSVPPRQRASSVVLADRTWAARERRRTRLKGSGARG